MLSGKKKKEEQEKLGKIENETDQVYTQKHELLFFRRQTILIGNEVRAIHEMFVLTELS
jgi:hypothetical protein